jgi:hypothetical protein
VGGRELAEVGGKPLLLLVSERDAAEDERLVLEKRLVEELDGLRVEVRVEIDADDLGSDASGDLADVSVGGDGAHAAFPFEVSSCRVVLGFAGRCRP